MADLISMLAAVAGSGGGADPNFNQTVLLLHGDGTNGAQNNTFLDSSTNNFTITRNGNTTQGTFSPFSLAAGEWSNYFDGTDDYLDVGNQTAHNFDGQFTVEAWVYRTVGSTNQAIAGKWALNNDAWLILIGSNNTITFYYESFNITTTATIPLNAWCHVAVTRDSSNDIRIFVDGVQTGSTTNSSANISGTASLTIGAYNSTGSITAYLTGYISNLRVIKGTALYTSAFTPSTTPLTAITNTSLLTCQSNRFVDNSTANSGTGFTITRNGDVRVTPFSPFAPTAAYSAGTNGGSGYFDGTGDYLTAPDDNAWSFAGDFTVEAWAYPISFAAERCVIAHWYGGSNAATSLNINFASSTGNVVAVLAIGSTQYTLTSASAYPAGCWHHIALVRSGSTVTLYVNGASAATTTASGTTNNLAHPLSIGALNALGSYIVPFLGYIAGVRILNGSAQVPPAGGPTSPPTAITNTSLLLNFTNAGIIDNTGKNNLETVGNAQIDTTTKKYGTGSMEFDGTDDRIFTPSSVDLIMGTGNFTIEGWFYANSISNKGIFQLSSTAGGLDPSAATANIAFALQTNGYTVYAANTGTTITSVVPSTTTWTHFAVVRSSGVTRLYINGSQAGSNITDTTNYAGGNLVVGGYYSTSYLFNGFIDDLRITKGVARYTVNFTPPTAAFPDL